MPSRRTMQEELVAVPSNLREIQNSPEESTTTSSSFVELKAIVITWPGTYRFKFSARRAGSNDTTEVEIRRNGTRVGIAREFNVGTWTTFIEDIGGWEIGDTAAVYGLVAAGAGRTEVQSFSVWGEYSWRPPAIPAGKITKAS